MARTEIPITVLGADGRPLAGASVLVRTRPANADATVYVGETGGTTTPNPLTTDAAGRVTGWLDRGSYAATISASGLTTYVENFESRPGDLEDGEVTAAKILDGTVTATELAAALKGGPAAAVEALRALGTTATTAAAGNDGRLSDQRIPTDGSVSAVKLAAAIAAALVPAGAIVPFAGAAAPTGYLLCDGSAISRTGGNAALFAAIGTAYGAGDGSTTFNLPDLRGRVAVGKGTHADVDTLGDSDGLAVGSRKVKHKHGTGSLATSTAGNHQHTTDMYSGSAWQFNDGLPARVYGPVAGVSSSGLSVAGNHTHPLTGEVGDTGGPADAPAHVVVNHIIKT